MAHSMAKNDSVEMTAVETFPEDLSKHPITRPATLQQEPLPDWPSHPHPLKPSRKSEMLLDAFDISLIAITVGLIVKAILCIVASRIDEKNSGYAIDQASMLSRSLIQFNHRLTTIFTIIFSLIMTTLFRRLALYRAQEGSATIAELEQLQASSSLPGALKAMWSLRSFSFVSLYLIGCWFWYYMGSQATTYEYELVASGSNEWFNIAYPSPSAQSVFNSSLGPDDVVITNVNSNFLANFETVTPVSGADLSGAALVPLYDFINSNEYQVDEFDQENWWDVSERSNIFYASYIGLPFISVSSAVSDADGLLGDVALNTTILNVTCAAPVVQSAGNFPNGTLANSTISINMTTPSTFSTVAVDDPPASFDMWIRANATSKSVSASCHINTVFIEMQVRCHGTYCAATKARGTRGDHLPVNRSPFDDRDFGFAFFNELLISNGIPSGDINGDYTGYSGIEAIFIILFHDYIDAIYSPQAELPDPSNDIAESEWIASYMTPMINTYYQASLIPQLHVVRGTGHTPSPGWSIANCYGAAYQPQYHLSIPWVILDILSCAVLLVSAVGAFRIRKRTIAPDIFGYVSSLTRNNPDLVLPDGGSTLSGFERSRLLKNVRIKITDVSGDAEVGRIGLRNAGTGNGWGQMESTETTQLKLDRHYL